MIGNQSLQIFFKTFEKYPLDQVGLNVYALADAAQDKTFLKVLEHLRQKCLLKEAGGEKAREISPHLLQYTDPERFSAPQRGHLINLSPIFTYIMPLKGYRVRRKESNTNFCDQCKLSPV